MVFVRDAVLSVADYNSTWMGVVIVIIEVVVVVVVAVGVVLFLANQLKNFKIS